VKFGIQVNVGPPGSPDWRWLHRCDMGRGEWNTITEARQQMLEWHPNELKAHLFRVREIDEGP
jgi:hypothetical protein